MRIVVRNNDPMKAFKLLNRKLYEDNTFVELKDKQFFKSKGEKKRKNYVGASEWEILYFMFSIWLYVGIRTPGVASADYIEF